MVRTKKSVEVDLKSKSKQAGIDFDPRPVALHNNNELVLYLNKYHHRRGPVVGVHLCKGDVKYSEAAPEGGGVTP